MEKWMIDAGHGGKDTGYIYNSLIEKEVVLKIAEEIKVILEKNNKEVILSRKEDTFLEEYKRAELANSYLVDYFISIHMNYSADEEIHGTEVYVFDNDGISEVIGNNVKDALVKGLKTNDRGIHIINSTILRESNMPTIIIKCDYISNSEFARTLDIKKIAKLITEGLLKNIEEPTVEKSNGENVEIKGWKLCIGHYDKYNIAQERLNELKCNGYNDAYIIPGE